MYICVIAGILPTEVNSKRLPKILAISHTKYVFWLNLLCSCYKWQWTTPHDDPAIPQLEGSIFPFPVLYVLYGRGKLATLYATKMYIQERQEDCKKVEEAHHWLLWTIARCKFFKGLKVTLLYQSKSSWNKNQQGFIYLFKFYIWTNNNQQ